MIDKKRTEFYVKGVGKVKSIDEMAKISGKSRSKILIQRGKGATDEQLMLNKSITEIDVNGKTFYTMPEVLIHYGVELTNPEVSYKLSKGASIEEVIREYKEGVKPDYLQFPTKNGKKVVIEGKKYDSMTKAYKAYENDERVVRTYNKIRNEIYNGEDPETAFFAK